jgi:hypothetical protein
LATEGNDRAFAVACQKQSAARDQCAITKKLRDVEELPSNPQPLLKDLLGESENDE